MSLAADLMSTARDSLSLRPLVAQWIEQPVCEVRLWVRIPPRGHLRGEILLSGLVLDPSRRAAVLPTAPPPTSNPLPSANYLSQPSYHQHPVKRRPDAPPRSPGEVIPHQMTAMTTRLWWTADAVQAIRGWRLPEPAPPVKPPVLALHRNW